jgi:carboxylesterase
MAKQTVRGIQRWWPMLLVILIIAGAVFALFQPWKIAGLTSHPNPAQSYDQAVQRIQAIQAGEANLNPLCQTQFMTHGQSVEKVIIFVHGYTNCPQQFAELGKRFYDLGYNVLIVPEPHHGLGDRMTDEQRQITSEKLAAYADEVVDIAQGLGDKVVITGFSMGGVVTAWAAQNRSDLDLAVIISPGFGFKQVPTPMTVPMAHIVTILPVSYDWWDPALKENIRPDHAYPRYSKFVLGQIMRLGFSVRAKARQSAPGAHALIVVTNANDQSVNNELTGQVVQTWQASGANISTYEFDIGLGLGHDLIDPHDKDANIEVVYSRLIDLIDK